MTGTEPHAPRGTAGRGTNWDRGPCAGYVAFKIFVPQVTVSDGSTIFFCTRCQAYRIVRWGFESLSFELGTESIKADGEENRQSSYNSNCV